MYKDAGTWTCKFLTWETLRTEDTTVFLKAEARDNLRATREYCIFFKKKKNGEKGGSYSLVGEEKKIRLFLIFQG